MELLKIEDMDNQLEMLKVIYGAWEEIKTVLAGFSSPSTARRMGTRQGQGTLPLIIDIAKFSVQEMFTIPTEKN